MIQTLFKFHVLCAPFETLQFWLVSVVLTYCFCDYGSQKLSFGETALASIGSEAASLLNRALLNASTELSARSAATHAQMRQALVLAELQGK